MAFLKVWGSAPHRLVSANITAGAQRKGRMDTWSGSYHTGLEIVFLQKYCELTLVESDNWNWLALWWRTQRLYDTVSHSLLDTWLWKLLCPLAGHFPPLFRYLLPQWQTPSSSVSCAWIRTSPFSLPCHLA